MKNRVLNKVAIVVLIALLAPLLLGPTTRASASATLGLSVERWDFEASTGTASFSVSVGGSCATSCSWTVNAVDRSTGTQVHRYQIGSGGATALPQTFTTSRVGEVTHVVATLTSGGTTQTREVAVLGTAPQGLLSLNVNKFTKDSAIGTVDYDVTVVGQGLGSRLSPCSGSCSYNITAVDRSTGTEKYRFSLSAGSIGRSGRWVFDDNYVGKRAVEITHLVVTLTGNGLVWKKEVPVEGAGGPGMLNLNVDRFVKDFRTGEVDYGVTLVGSGLASEASPCAGSCSYNITAVDRSTGTEKYRFSLSAGSVGRTGRWSFNDNYLGKRAVEITHLVVTLSGNGLVWTREVPVAGAGPAGTLALHVNDFTKDFVNGEVTYDVTLDGAGLASEASPCAGSCSYNITAVDRSTGTEKYRFSLSAGSVGRTGRWSFNDNYVGKRAVEVTHLVVTLTGNGLVWKKEVPVAGAGDEGSLNLKTNSFHKDFWTGEVAYDVTLEGAGLASEASPCAGSCSYNITAVDRSTGTEKYRFSLSAGSVGRTGRWSFNDNYVGKRAVEITHLVVTLTGGNGVVWTRDVPVAGAGPEGSLWLNINGFDKSFASGEMEYDVTLVGTGLGSEASPCAGSCSYNITAVDRSTGTEKYRFSLSAGSVGRTGRWSFNDNYVGKRAVEVTHFIVTLTGNGLTWTREVPVPGAGPAGNLWLNFTEYHQDSSSGAITYDVTLVGRGLGSEASPCSGVCVYDITAVDRSTSTEQYRFSLSSGSVSRSGRWWFDDKYAGTRVANVTHLVVKLQGGNGLDWVQEVPVGGAYVSPLFSGSNAQYASMIPVPASTAICDLLVFSPTPSLNGNSLPDDYEMCLALTGAATVVTVGGLITAIDSEYGTEVAAQLRDDIWEQDPNRNEDDAPQTSPVVPAPPLPTETCDPPVERRGGSKVTPVRLYRTGKSPVGSDPGIYPPRPKVGDTGDVTVDDDGMICPEYVNGYPAGLSTFSTTEHFQTGNHLYSLPAGTVLPEGLEVIADGPDAIPPGPVPLSGHHTIFPTRPMAFTEFVQLTRGLPWIHEGKT